MTDSNQIIGSDRFPKLTAEQRTLVTTLLDLIIPPSDDGRMPSAAEYDVIGHIRSTNPETLPTIVRALEALEARSRSTHHQAFIDLSKGEQLTLLEEMRRDENGFLLALAQATVVVYYQQDAVLEGIGMEPRPPFPEGYEVKSGDLSLLEPVRERGQRYRKSK